MWEDEFVSGVNSTHLIQNAYEDYEPIFLFSNNIGNPKNIYDYIFPALSIVDSLFAAQVMWVFLIGTWLNILKKWVSLDGRTFWWGKMTDYYTAMNIEPPVLQQDLQTCDTNPGMASTGSFTITMMVVLILLCIYHLCKRNGINLYYAAAMVLPPAAFVVWAGGAAPVYVAEHFPRQCVIGLLQGILLTLVIWHPSIPRPWAELRGGVASRLYDVLMMMIIPSIVFNLVKMWWDPLQCITMSFRWCTNPEYTNMLSKQVLLFACSVAARMGWDFAVTSNIYKYRYNTKKRSLMISASMTLLVCSADHYIQATVSENKSMVYFFTHLFLAGLKPFLLLKTVPFLAMLPYNRNNGNENAVAQAS